MGVLHNPGLFCDLQFVLDLGSLPFAKKKKLRSDITSNGGYVSYILTKKSNFVVSNCEKGSKIDTYKTRKAEQLHVPVVTRTYIEDSIACGKLLDTDDYKVAGKTKRDIFSEGKIEIPKWQFDNEETPRMRKLSEEQIQKLVPEKYNSNEKTCPHFSNNFQVGKFAVLMAAGSETDVYNICVLELHFASVQNRNESSDEKQVFRIMEQNAVITENLALNEQTSHEYFFNRFGDGLAVMQYLVDKQVNENKMTPINYLPRLLDAAVGSTKLTQLFDNMGQHMGDMNPHVYKAFGVIGFSFDEVCSSMDADDITVNQINEARVVLMKIREALENGEPTDDLSEEYYNIVVSHNTEEVISNKKMLSAKFDYVQGLQDAKMFNEATWPLFNDDSYISAWSSSDTSSDDSTSDISSASSTPSHDMDEKIMSLYLRGIRCSMTWIPPGDADHDSVMQLLGIVDGVCGSRPDFELVNIFSLYRDAEFVDFTHSMENKKLLFHSTKPCNLFGILSRGLLLPQVVVGEHGGDRTDRGLLGGGIYFSDDVRTSVKYSKPTKHTGTRFLLVNEVCLGQIAHFTEPCPQLQCPPEGSDSVQGVGKTETAPSEFEANEFVVYDKKQQRLRYLIEYVLEDDKIKDPKKLKPKKSSLVFPPKEHPSETVSIDDVDHVTDPNQKVKPGLIVEEAGKSKQVPLRQVHIRGSIIDLVAEVVVFQSYVNDSDEALEAKYVFPLSGSAAVCGFEAFINGKHVIGEVKEKEQAHREYKKAISQGHGAYLMDEEKPEVFTVSVGNLPPGARVVIKITYVTELPVMINESDLTDYIQFHLPNTVAPTVKDSVLVSGPITQMKTGTVVADSGKLNNFSLVISVEMPFDIKRLECPTNKIKYKMTRSKATVRLLNRESFGKDGFQLLIGLAEIHVPRMWSERHPITNSQASMLAFYPEFDAPPVQSYKAIIVIDASNSIGSYSSFTQYTLECETKKLALLILRHLPLECHVNVVRFGSNFEELFVLEHPLSENTVRTKAKDFIQHRAPRSGMSDVWRWLAHQSAVQKFSEDKTLTNIFLISDGHLNETNKTLQLARELAGNPSNVCRIFTFSVDSLANQHFMKSIAAASDGFHEHFNSSIRSKWKQKVKNQLSKASQPVLTDIHIKWGKYNDKDDHAEMETSALPVQAPEHISTLYNSSRLVVYGMVPHCTQAELRAKICGKEISTIVSTSALSMTTGKTIHRLATRAMIQDYEDGMHEVDPLKRDALKKNRRPFIIDLSIEHSVVSQHTSFVAIEERKEGEQLVTADGPSVAELVADVEVDQLTALPWIGEEAEEDIVTLDKVRELIRSAEVAYFSSMIEADRLFNEVHEMSQQLPTYEHIKACMITALTKTRLNLEIKEPEMLADINQLKAFLLEAASENDTEALDAIKELGGLDFDESDSSGCLSEDDEDMGFSLQCDMLVERDAGPLGEEALLEDADLYDDVEVHEDLLLDEVYDDGEADEQVYAVVEKDVSARHRDSVPSGGVPLLESSVPETYGFSPEKIPQAYASLRARSRSRDRSRDEDMWYADYDDEAISGDERASAGSVDAKKVESSLGEAPQPKDQDYEPPMAVSNLAEIGFACASVYVPPQAPKPPAALPEKPERQLDFNDPEVRSRIFGRPPGMPILIGGGGPVGGSDGSEKSWGESSDNEESDDEVPQRRRRPVKGVTAQEYMKQLTFAKLGKTANQVPPWLAKSKIRTGGCPAPEQYSEDSSDVYGEVVAVDGMLRDQEKLRHAEPVQPLPSSNEKESFQFQVPAPQLIAASKQPPPPPPPCPSRIMAQQQKQSLITKGQAADTSNELLQQPIEMPGLLFGQSLSAGGKKQSQSFQLVEKAPPKPQWPQKSDMAKSKPSMPAWKKAPRRKKKAAPGEYIGFSFGAFLNKGSSDNVSAATPPNKSLSAGQPDKLESEEVLEVATECQLNESASGETAVEAKEQDTKDLSVLKDIDISCWDSALKELSSKFEKVSANEKPKHGTGLRRNEFVFESLKKAGGPSLGLKVFDALYQMVHTAILVSMLKKHCKNRSTKAEAFENLIEKLKSWLKKMDAIYPNLHSRLELGNTWEKAGEYVVARILTGSTSAKTCFTEILTMSHTFVYY